MIINSLGAVITVLLITALGYFLAAKKIITPQVGTHLASIIFWALLPANIIYTFEKNFSRELLAESWIMLLAIFAAVLIIHYLALGIAHIIKIPKERRGVFCVIFTMCNSAFVGFPMAQAIFGDQGMPYAVLFFMPNVVIANTLSYMAIRRDGDLRLGEKTKFSLREMLKRLVMPHTIAIVVGFVLVGFGIQLPSFLMNTCEYLGTATTAISMLFIGSLIHKIGLRNMGYEKGFGMLMIGRFIISPLVVLGVCLICNIDQYATTVFTTQMALPAMTQVAIHAEMFGADSVFAAKGVCWTTLLSFVAIPAVVLLCNVL